MRHIFSVYRKHVAVLLALMLAVSMLPAEAASAASVNLNRRSASVLVEKSIRLSVSGTKKTVKWSSSDSSVASVYKGKVTGKKPGKVTITAKVSGKTLKCNVTVKYNAAAAEKKLVKSTQNLPTGILIRYTNKNSYPISVSAKMSFRDAVKTAISVEEDHNYCLEAGKSSYFFFKKPVDSNYQYITYTDYKLSLKTKASPYKGYTEDITQWCKPGVGTMSMTAYNYSGKDLTAAKISCLLYDSRGKVTGYISYFPGCLKKRTHIEENINYPTYLTNPSQVKTFVDYAY